MHDPWVLSFKVGSLRILVKWLDLENRGVSKQASRRETRDAASMKRVSKEIPVW